MKMTPVRNSVRLAACVVFLAMLVAAIPTQAIAAERDEEIPMPLYNQYDYAGVPYRNSDVAGCGCGITCLSMVATYIFQDESLTPEYLARTYGNHFEPVDGVDYDSLMSMMVSIGELLGLEMDLTWSFSEAVEALEEGKVVISIQNEGLFTDKPNGHFIVFRGVTEAGDILVNDPNGYTWSRYPTWFANGFPQANLRDTGGGYWIVTKASTN